MKWVFPTLIQSVHFQFTELNSVICEKFSTKSNECALCKSNRDAIEYTTCDACIKTLHSFWADARFECTECTTQIHEHIYNSFQKLNFTCEERGRERMRKTSAAIKAFAKNCVAVVIATEKVLAILQLKTCKLGAFRCKMQFNIIVHYSSIT